MDSLESLDEKETLEMFVKLTVKLVKETQQLTSVRQPAAV